MDEPSGMFKPSFCEINSLLHYESQNQQPSCSYTYNIAYTNTPHGDGYSLMLEDKEFDYTMQ